MIKPRPSQQHKVALEHELVGSRNLPRSEVMAAAAAHLLGCVR